MKTKLLLPFGAIVLVLAFVIGRATFRTNRSEAERQTLAPQSAALREKAGRLEQRLRAARAAAVALEFSSAGSAADRHAPGAVVAPSDNQGSAPAGNGARLSAQTIIANSPPKMKTYLAEFRETLDLDYGGMFKALGLTPAQIQKFKELQVALLASKMDLQAAIETQALDPNGAEAKQLLADWQRSRTAKESEVLGAGIESFRAYNRMRDARELAKSLVWTSVYAGESISCSQVEQTAQVLAANSRYGRMEGNSINWEAAKDQLRGSLSPSQIATLATRIEQIAVDARVNQQINQRVAALTAEFKSQQAPK